MRAWVGWGAALLWVGCAVPMAASRTELVGERENRVLQLRGEPDNVDFVHWPQATQERHSGPMERWIYCQGTIGPRCADRLELYFHNGTVWATRRIAMVPEGSGSP